MNWRAFASGVLTLIILETVTRPASAGRVGGLLGTVAAIVDHAFSPNTPAIPDLRAGPWPSATSSTASSTTPPKTGSSSGSNSVPLYPLGLTL